MIAECLVTDHRDWWQGYSSGTEDKEARARAAQKLGIPPEAVELRRNGGAVLARERKEKCDESR